MKIFKIFAVFMFFVQLAVQAEEPSVQAVLFNDHSAIDIVLSAPFSQIKSSRSQAAPEQFAAKLKAALPNTQAEELSLKLRVRGNFRRQRENCQYPPLRLNFAKKSVSGVFAEQDKLKLVTQCKRGPRYQQLVLKEYLAYRVFNILTDNSFKVRLLNAEYVNTDDKNKSLFHQAFVIEHKNSLVKRLDSSFYEAEEVPMKLLDKEHTTLVFLYEFLIGNTDWSIFLGRPGNNCCHNFISLKFEERLLSIPYDFDFSGMVNAPYATPNPGLGISRVKQRLYRGHCEFNPQLQAAVELVQQKKSAIYALYNDEPGLDKKTRKSTLAYIDSFYKILDSDKLFKRKISGKCR